MEEDRLIRCTSRDVVLAEAFRDMEGKVLALDTMTDILVSARDAYVSNKEERTDLLITLFNDMWNDFAQEYRNILERQSGRAAECCLGRTT